MDDSASRAGDCTDRRDRGLPADRSLDGYPAKTGPSETSKHTGPACRSAADEHWLVGADHAGGCEDLAAAGAAIVSGCAADGGHAYVAADDHAHAGCGGEGSGVS